MADAESDEDLPDKAKALLGLARLAYEWNILDEAEAYARSVLEIGKQLVDDMLQVEASLILTHILHVRGQSTLAQQNLGTLIARIKPHPSQQLQREVLAFRAQLHLADGNLPEAAEWLIMRTHYNVTLSPLQHEQEELLNARLLIAQGKFEQALRELNFLYPIAHDAGRIRTALEIQMVMILAHIACHDLRSAQALAGTLVLYAQSAGYQRLFLDEGIVIVPLLQSLLLEQHGHPATASYVKSLLTAFHLRPSRMPSTNAVSTSAIELLTSQEERILYFFANGLSKKEIAEQLLISVNTVKTHLKRIYQKLNVSSRAEAREMAQHLKLLE